MYRVIKQDAINVLVPYEPETFDALVEEVRQTGLTRSWMKRARPHTVNAYRPQSGDTMWDRLEAVTVGRETSDDWFICVKRDDYDDLAGFHPKALDSQIA